MREMGFMRTATPLVSESEISGPGDSAEGFEVMYGRDSPEASSTWDSRSVFGCVCDSSREVRGAHYIVRREGAKVPNDNRHHAARIAIQTCTVVEVLRIHIM